MRYARTHRRSGPLLALLVAASVGCSTVERVQIVSEPPGAFISIDKQNVGKSPVHHEYDAAIVRSFSVTADLEGYFPETVAIDTARVGYLGGLIKLVLRENPAWNETTTCQATNTWLRFQVHESISKDECWQKIIDAVTSAYDTLEQIDPASGYLRSAAYQRAWNVGSSLGSYYVRTQLVGSIASLTPLIYKFQIKSEYRWGNSADWKPYERVFKKDAELIEELNNRLGPK